MWAQVHPLLIFFLVANFVVLLGGLVWCASECVSSSAHSIPGSLSSPLQILGHAQEQLMAGVMISLSLQINLFQLDPFCSCVPVVANYPPSPSFLTHIHVISFFILPLSSLYDLVIHTFLFHFPLHCLLPASCSFYSYYSLYPLLLILRGRSLREKEFQSVSMPEELMSGVREVGESHQSFFVHARTNLLRPLIPFLTAQSPLAENLGAL